MSAWYLMVIVSNFAPEAPLLVRTREEGGDCRRNAGDTMGRAMGSGCGKRAREITRL